jgi:hypothetical protein
MNLSSKTALCYDFGLFQSFCQKLSESFGRVFYYSEYKKGFPLSIEAAIGVGMPGLERVMDFEDHIDEADVIVFPDIYHGAMQVRLRAEGKRVWGSGKAEELEIKRVDTKKFLTKIGLPMNKYRKITGIKPLKEYLKGVEDKWIKTEGFRGDGETFHFDNYKLAEPRLNELEFKLGPMGKARVFIVEDPIDSVSEWGYDNYTIDGQFAKTGIQGIEKKNEGYGGIVRPYADIIKQLRYVNAKMATALKKYEYRGLYSTEVRITKDGTGYFIDPCCRGASPAGECYQNLYTNWGEIVWGGSNGEMVEPEIDKGEIYGVEVLINCEAGSRPWVPVYFPKEIEPFVKLRNACRIDGEYNISNQDHGTVQVGAVVAKGKSFVESIKKLAGYCKQIEGLGIDVKCDAIASVMDAMRDSEKAGMSVAPDPIPTKEEVAKALGA